MRKRDLSPPHFVGHRKRLKKRFENSPQSFEDYELLELLLGYAIPRRDTKPLAKELLTRFGKLKKLIFASKDELIEIKGISNGFVIFLRLIREIISRIELQDMDFGQEVFDPRGVFEYVRTRIGFEEKESFWALLLNSKNRVISLEKLTQGTVNYLKIYPREIIEVVLKRDAVGIIFLHNHPGGDPQPSKEDILFTKRLYNICRELDIDLLDHIIISYDSYFSLKENQLL